MKKTGSGSNNTNKTKKKSKNKISSNKNKERSPYINLASTGNNSTRSTNTQTPLIISTSLLSFEYEYIIQKLLRYLKQKLTIIQYEDIKAFIYNEINKIVSNKTINNNNYSILDKKDSLKIYKSYRNNINNLCLNSNKFNNNSKKEKNNEKNLKLSYDFSNRFISSPKNNNNNKPIRIVLENIKINEKAKSTSKSKYSKNYKDKYSLYSIMKSSHSYSYNNNKKKINNNSHSKSKSKSTSRENFNMNLNNNRTINSKSDNITINNTNINQINSSSSITKGIFNSISSNNNRDINQKSKKYTTIKSTLIHQSLPLLNEKLFSKLTNSNNRTKSSKKNNIVYNTISNISVSKITKSISYKTEPNISHNINISLTNKSNNFKNENNYNSLRINSYRKKVKFNNKNLKNKNKKNNLIIKNQINYLSPSENNKIKITNISPKHRNNNNNNNNNLEFKTTQIPVLKNEEMIKQIKNTIDDNLKVMFNFSYENFLSKESEHESKEISREINMNVSNENI